MSLSLSTLVRLGVLVTLLANAVAIAISQTGVRHVAKRVECETPYTTLNGYFLPSRETTPRVIDAATGAISPIPITDKHHLDHASFSPWRDEEGRYQVVGRWSSANEQLDAEPGRGIARYSFPDGQLLEKIETDMIVAGPPCWFPGISTRVIFPAGDGKLYVTNFREDENASGPSSQPELVRWDVEGFARAEDFAVNDLIWPRDPRFGGRMLATIALVDSSSRTTLLRPSMYWLELDELGTTVVAATPVATSDDLLEQSMIRCPTVVQADDGKLSLVILARSKQSSAWQAWLASLEFESPQSLAMWDSAKATLLIHGCVPSTPAISRDHQWLACLAEKTSGAPQVLRVRLTPAHKAQSSDKLANYARSR